MTCNKFHDKQKTSKPKN